MVEEVILGQGNTGAGVGKQGSTGCVSGTTHELSDWLLYREVARG